jgi:hypothetical protein
VHREVGLLVAVDVQLMYAAGAGHGFLEDRREDLFALPLQHARLTDAQCY